MCSLAGFKCQEWKTENYYWKKYWARKKNINSLFTKKLLRFYFVSGNDPAYYQLLSTQTDFCFNFSNTFHFHSVFCRDLNNHQFYSFIFWQKTLALSFILLSLTWTTSSWTRLANSWPTGRRTCSWLGTSSRTGRPTYDNSTESTEQDASNFCTKSTYRHASLSYRKNDAVSFSASDPSPR